MSSKSVIVAQKQKGISNNSSILRNSNVTLTSRKSSILRNSNVTPTSRKSSILLKSNVLQTKKNNINALKSIDAQCKKIINMVDFHIYFFRIVLKNKKYMKANKGFIEYLKSINDIIIKFNAEYCSRLSFAVLLFYYLYEINIYNIKNNNDNLKKIIDAFTENSLLSTNPKNKYSYFLTIFYASGEKTYTRFTYEDSDLYYLLYEYYKIYKIHKYDIKKFVYYLFIAGFNGGKSVTNWIEPLLIILSKYKNGEISGKYIIKAIEFPTLYQNIKDITTVSGAFGNIPGCYPIVSKNFNVFWKYYIENNIQSDREDRPNVIQLIDNLFKYINSKNAEALKLSNNISVKYSDIKEELTTHLSKCISMNNLDIIEELAANVTNDELKSLLIENVEKQKANFQKNELITNSIGTECDRSDLVFNCKIDGSDTGPLCKGTLEDYDLKAEEDCVKS